MARHPDGEGTDLASLPDPAGLTPAARAALVQEAVARAEELRRAGRHDEGIQLLLSVLRYEEQKAQVLFRLGNLYFEQDDLARAEHAYRRATEEDPHHASARHNLGVVYRRQGKISQSVKMLKRAQWLDVRYPPRRATSRGERGAVRRWGWWTVAISMAVLCVVVLIWLVGRSLLRSS